MRTKQTARANVEFLNVVEYRDLIEGLGTATRSGPDQTFPTSSLPNKGAVEDLHKRHITEDHLSENLRKKKKVDKGSHPFVYNSLLDHTSGTLRLIRSEPTQNAETEHGELNYTIISFDPWKMF
jgi:hypothetical protein